MGFLAPSPPAQAHQILPLAPACSQWGFPGACALHQTNGDTVRFDSTGSVASGLVEATTPKGLLRGPVSGGATVAR